MAKICFPHYKKGEFASLADAVKYLYRKKYAISGYELWEIVRYNVCYRNHLRQFGLDSLIDRLVEEAPLLKKCEVLVRRLRERLAKIKLADYDIQCYNIRDQITILGHTFDGLKDVRRHMELAAYELFGELHYVVPKRKARPYNDVHIGHFYDTYPVFDCWDYADDRTFQNYIFRTAPITEEDMKESFRTFHGLKFCMVHEHIPEERLPILYYSGDGKYMLLATKS